MVTAKDVAKYFLLLSDPDIGDLISNLKLQKLVYYAQGFHLAMYDTPLFNDEIEAWLHGPVVPSLYREYKQYEDNALPVPCDFDDSVFSVDQKDLLIEVYKAFGQFSAWKLRNMTHEESPWKDTNINDVITHGALKRYFKTQLVDEQ